MINDYAILDYIFRMFPFTYNEFKRIELLGLKKRTNYYNYVHYEFQYNEVLKALSNTPTLSFDAKIVDELCNLFDLNKNYLYINEKIKIINTEQRFNKHQGFIQEILSAKKKSVLNSNEVRKEYFIETGEHPYVKLSKAEKYWHYYFLNQNKQLKKIQQVTKYFLSSPRTQEIDILVEKLKENYFSIKEGSKTSLEHITKELNPNIIYYSFKKHYQCSSLKKKYGSSIIFEDEMHEKYCQIVVNKTDKRKIRFTLLHEILHFFIDFHSSIEDNEKEKIINYIVGKILIQDDYLDLFRGRNIDNSFVRDVEKLSDQLMVSKEAIKKRILQQQLLSISDQEFFIQYNAILNQKKASAFWTENEQEFLTQLLDFNITYEHNQYQLETVMTPHIIYSNTLQIELYINTHEGKEELGKLTLAYLPNEENTKEDCLKIEYIEIKRKFRNKHISTNILKQLIIFARKNEIKKLWIINLKDDGLVYYWLRQGFQFFCKREEAVYIYNLVKVLQSHKFSCSVNLETHSSFNIGLNNILQNLDKELTGCFKQVNNCDCIYDTYDNGEIYNKIANSKDFGQKNYMLYLGV